jgi:hypothetical protein
LSHQVKDASDSSKNNHHTLLSVGDQLVALDKKIRLMNGRNHHESVAHIIAALEPKMKRGLKRKHMWLHFVLSSGLIVCLLMLSMQSSQLKGEKVLINERAQAITSLQDAQKLSTASFNQIFTQKETNHATAMKRLNAKYIKSLDYGSDHAMASARVKALISVQDADIDQLKKTIRLLEIQVATKTTGNNDLAWFA